jgi:hypothetical protein
MVVPFGSLRNGGDRKNFGFMNFRRNVATSLLCERSRSLRTDRKDRPRTDGS